MRTITPTERTTIAAPHVSHFAKFEVQDTGGTWRDLSALGSPTVDFLTRGDISEDIDQPVASGSVTLRREAGGQSLSPLVASSALNIVGGSYSPLLYAGRRCRLSGAVALPGDAPTWKLLCNGKIDRVDWHSSESEVVVEFRDLGSLLLDAFIEVADVEYGSLAGVPAQVVMQQLIDATYPGVTLTVIDDPLFAISLYKQAQSGLLEAIRNVALQYGGDVRYRFDPSDASTLQAWMPNRAKSLPDWTIGPSEYDDITALTVSDSDIRNIIKVPYIDGVTGLPASVTVTSAPSIALFGRRFMQITEDATSQIDTLGEASAMAGFALSDLAAPKADHEIKTRFFWPVQIADLGAFTSNNVHYNTDQLLAVVSFKHSFENGQWDTTIKTRGNPAAANRGWLTRGVDPGDIPTPGDPRALALKNFREVRRTPTVVTYGWNAVDTDVDAVWAWSKLSPQDVDPPLGAGANEDRLWRTIATDAPDVMLTPATLEFDVTVPDFGYVQTWELQPVNAALTRGYSQRVKVLSVPDIPRITDLTTAIGASGLFASITHLNVVDPQALGGTLKAWLNHTLTDDGNPSTAPDGTIAITITPRDVVQADTWNLTGGGTAQLFDNIRVHPGRGKRVFFEFVNSRGISSGLVVFVILSTGGIIDANGILLDGSINLASQVAASMTLMSVYATLPATGRANEVALRTSDFKVFRWNGTAWIADVPAVDITGTVSTLQIASLAITNALLAANAVTTTKIADNSISTPKVIAGAIQTASLDAFAVTAGKLAALAVTAGKIDALAVTAGTIAAGVVTTNELAANSVTAGKILAGAVTATAIQAGAINTVAIGTIVLSEIVPGSGIIQVGKLRSIDGLRYLDLNATGSNPFLQHPGMSLNADGSASFSGALSAASGTFAGTVSGTTFTSATINITGTDAALNFPNLSSSGAGLHWSNGGSFSNLICGVFGVLGFGLAINTTGFIGLNDGGGGVQINGKTLTFGAANSFAAGFRTVSIPN
jgi:hypothetical protein